MGEIVTVSQINDSQQVRIVNHGEAKKSNVHWQHLESPGGPQTISFDVGGKLLRLQVQDILSGAPRSRLTRLMSNPKRWMLELRFIPLPHSENLRPAYFIERPPSEVKIIRQYYENRVVRQPQSMCPYRLYHILQFWGIPLACVQDDHHPNPMRKLFARRDTDDSSDASLDTLQFVDFLTHTETITCSNLRRALAQLQRHIWLSIEKQETKLGYCFSFVSVLFIFLSLTGLILGSMQQFQMPAHYRTVMNDTDTELVDSKSLSFNERQPVLALRQLEHICIGWFSIEFILRTMAAHRISVFLKQTLNIIDLLTIIPFYVSTVFELFGVRAEHLVQITGAMVVLRALRVLRVARLLRLIRYSKALRVIVHSFTSSSQELAMFTMLTMTAVVFFATIEYFVECDVNPKFNSIPASCWWCVVTMTIIGYGDVVPITPLGKFVAAMASISGMLVLAFPVTMVVEKFVSRQQEVVQMIELQQEVERFRRSSAPARFVNNVPVRKRESVRHARFMRLNTVYK